MQHYILYHSALLTYIRINSDFFFEYFSMQAVSERAKEMEGKDFGSKEDPKAGLPIYIIISVK